MLILPIVNRKRVLNVEVRLKNARKIKTRVCYDDAKESEIIVNREKFSDSSFKDSKDVKAPIDFIRSKSLLYPRNFLVTTKEERDSTLYDVYEVETPPKKVNDSLDKLYSKAITDMQKEMPGTPKRGKYISFEDLGIGKYLTDEKIALLQKVIREERDSNQWSKIFAELGIADLSDTVEFINNFECTVLSDTSISEDSLEDTLNALSAINTKDYRNLNNYYNMAKSNAEIYTKISYISKIVYDKPLTLMHSKDRLQKKLIKKMDEMEHKKVG